MRRALADLWLGAQVALASRTTRLRTALTAAGVALGVVVLLLAASAPHAQAARNARVRAAAPVDAPHGRLRLLPFSTIFHGMTISENAVQVTRGKGPVPRPPGLARLPGPGTMVVSPAVQDLLRGPGGAELRRRLHARVVGTIAPAGLAEPNSALIYRGGTGLVADGQAAVGRFGTAVTGGQGLVLITLLVIVVVVALLLPVGVFVATAARFGAEERDRRLAAMRLIGADRMATARVAAGESLVGGLAGLVLGAGAFLLARPLAAHSGVAGVDVFTSDLTPSPVMAALVAVLVPLSAVAATLVSSRRVAVEPLGVSRRAPPRRRRLAWRLAVPALGFLVLWPLIGSSQRLSGPGGQVEASAGVVLVLVGLTAMLPWVVEGVVRRAPDGPLPWLLAVRRLRLEEGTTGRIVAAIGLAVAGAIALSIVFGAAQARVRVRFSSLEARTMFVGLHARSRAGAMHDLAVLRADPDVVSVSHVAAGSGQLAGTVVLRPGDPTAAAHLRDRAAGLDPLATVDSAASDNAEAHTLAELRRALFAGAVIVLAMIGASLLIAAGEGLSERRRALAVLGAVGARRSTVAWSVLWQTAIPVVGGLALACALGVALGAMLSAVVSLPPALDWGTIGLMLGAGVAVIAAVTALTLPTLSRMMRPEALRVE
jgi:hypothetical protein